MALNERGHMKDDIKKSIHALEKSAAYLIRVEDRFRGVHDEYLPLFDALIKAISDLRDQVIELAKFV